MLSFDDLISSLLINLKHVDLIAIAMFVVLFNKKTLASTIKVVCFHLMILFYYMIASYFRDLELFKLMINFHPRNVVEILTKVRLTSTKSLPDFKNVNLGSLLKAIYVRFTSKISSPVIRYIIWVREALLSTVKYIKQLCFESLHQTYAH